MTVVHVERGVRLFRVLIFWNVIKGAGVVKRCVVFCMMTFTKLSIASHRGVIRAFVMFESSVLSF